ncbi:asparagine synthase (glutamine-hydrolyzing) [Propionibacterium acidifaciens]|uniref:asparagine synthase (glutamine-hydrolyzing) n=1 Tax=Propionibacterium acidifaciens TaxID=556499 RepID=UPI0004162D29|nr:asparagine synthase (glutamine-hydrolyzing) [Propionibacterium acidifaciens]
MCGIVGIFRPEGVGAKDEFLATRMLGMVIHRGPDAQTINRSDGAVLGSARLAIVDVPFGGQPFNDESGSILVVFNGEITNHRELSSRLHASGHHLASHCDGEVIAHAYEEFGVSFAKHLEGQFAIALYDRRSKKLVLVRDRFGICPLVWTWNGITLSFASEAKALFAATVLNPRPDPEGMAQLCYFGTTVAPHTMFAGVNALPAGHQLVIDSTGSLTLTRYWRLYYPETHVGRRLDLEAAREELNNLLVRAVRRCIQGEYPPVTYLSGGVDSALVTSLARRHVPGRLIALSAGSTASKFDETSLAAEVANHLDVDLVTEVMTDVDIANVFSSLMWHLETPTLSTESAALHTLARRASGLSKVVLTGEGADEAFAGYQAFEQSQQLRWIWDSPSPIRALVRQLLHSRLASQCLAPDDSRLGRIRDAFGFIPAQAVEWEFYREVFAPVLVGPAGALLKADAPLATVEFDRSLSTRTSHLNASLAVSYEVMLGNYLLGPHGDRVLAGASVEGRYPFLDREVVEFAALLGDHAKISQGRNKVLLRLTAQHHVGPEVAWRAKKRFTMPFVNPFISPKSPELYRYLMAPQTIDDFGYFDVKQVATALGQLDDPLPSGSRGRRRLVRLRQGLLVTLVATTQLWHYTFFEQPISLESNQSELPMGENHV